jgi:hypothetical protein
MNEQQQRIRSPRRVTVGAALIAAAAFGVMLGAPIAHGAPQQPTARAATLGSDIGALDITADANGVRVPMYSHQAEDVEARIPYSLVTLGTGGIGNALTSVFYPGSTGAHGGDTLNLLGLPIPANVGQKLNDPQIAQAQTGVGDSKVDMSHPGLTMTATATSTLVNAESAAGGSGVPAIGPIVGSVSAHSNIRVTGPKTVAVTSVSTVHNISIAKVIKIGTVTSTAKALLNTRAPAKGSAKTVVAGMKIAGVAVTLDQKGLHIPSSSLPLVGSTATKVVNTALKGAGISLEVTKNIRHVKGAHVALDAGAMIVKFGNADYQSQGNDTGKLVVLGGAVVNGTVHHGYTFKPPAPTPTPTPTPTPKTHHSIPPSSGGTQPTSGGGLPPVQPAPSDPGVTVAPGPTGGVQLAANPLTLPGGLKVWWIVMALIGVGLCAAGMRRLPDQVLQTAGTSCSLEE